MKKTIIAESGSTKSLWKLPDHPLITTIGLNPYQANEALVSEVMERSPDLLSASSECEQLIFFGAGCGPEEASVRMYTLLQPYFPQAEIKVLSDMEAAAQALIPGKSGMVGILGTGSNVGFYNATTNAWTYTVPSLGWALADEGGGVSLGKALIKAYTRKKLSTAAMNHFDQFPQLSLTNLLDHLYRAPLPNRFLATFAPSILALSADESVLSCIIHPVFEAFATDIVLPTATANQCNTLGLVGSIAYHFQPFISSALEEIGVELTAVCASPIEHL